MTLKSGETRIAILDVEGVQLECVPRPGSPPKGNWSHIPLHVPDFDYKIYIVDKIVVREEACDNG